MRGLWVSIGKSLLFLLLWGLLLAPVVMTAVSVGGEHWFGDIGWRLFAEVGGTIVILAALVFMAFAIDKRGAETLGFNPRRLPDLLFGTVFGATIFAAPLALLVALGAARVTLDLSGFAYQALGLALVLCFFNVVTQEVLMRSYIFQEFWKKNGATVAIAVTTALSVALHARAVMEGTAGLFAAFNIAAASVMMGLGYVRTNALWFPIGIHFGWNGLQGPVLGINVTGQDIGLGHWRVFEFGGDPLLTGGLMGVEGGLVGLVGPLLGLAAVALIWRRKPRQ